MVSPRGDSTNTGDNMILYSAQFNNVRMRMKNGYKLSGRAHVRFIWVHNMDRSSIPSLSPETRGDHPSLHCRLGSPTYYRMRFRTMLTNAADQLTPENVASLTYIHGVCCKAGREGSEGPKALEVLRALEDRRAFSAEQPEPLEDILAGINRHDVANGVVKDFRVEMTGSYVHVTGMVVGNTTKMEWESICSIIYGFAHAKCMIYYTTTYLPHVYTVYFTVDFRDKVKLLLMIYVTKNTPHTLALFTVQVSAGRTLTRHYPPDIAPGLLPRNIASPWILHTLHLTFIIPQLEMRSYFISLLGKHIILES